MNNPEILISIIVPAYNAENTLERCVLSILAQSHLNLQIILIDDGSTDSTFELSERLALRDERIEVYHTGNGGSVAARKFGLRVSKGRYIGFVDSDDYIEPDMFQDLLEAIISADADFVHSGYIEEYRGKKNTVWNFPQMVIDVKDIQSKMEFFRSYIMRGNKNRYITPSLVTKLFKAEFIKKCFGDLDDIQQYGEDFICLFRCILEGHRIMMYRKAMYHYLIREKSLSHMNYEDYVIKEIGLWPHLIKVLEEYQYLEIAKDDMYFFLRRLMMRMISVENQTDSKISQYYFKEIKRVIGKKIVLFGAGNVGQDYYAQFSKYKECNVIAWADTYWNKYHFEYMDVVGLKEVLIMPFDLIIIAVKDEIVADEIKNSLVQAGIRKEKIVWDEPGEFF